MVLLVLGIRVESILPSCFWLSVILHCVLIQSLCYDLHDGGVPHTSTCAYICRVTCEAQSSMVLPEAMINGVGLGICMPTGTCHRMSMGRVG